MRRLGALISEVSWFTDGRQEICAIEVEVSGGERGLPVDKFDLPVHFLGGWHVAWFFY